MGSKRHGSSKAAWLMRMQACVQRMSMPNEQACCWAWHGQGSMQRHGAAELTCAAIVQQAVAIKTSSRRNVVRFPLCPASPAASHYGRLRISSEGARDSVSAHTRLSPCCQRAANRIAIGRQAIYSHLSERQFFAGNHHCDSCKWHRQGVYTPLVCKTQLGNIANHSRKPTSHCGTR